MEPHTVKIGVTKHIARAVQYPRVAARIRVSHDLDKDEDEQCHGGQGQNADRFRYGAFGPHTRLEAAGIPLMFLHAW